MPDWENYILSVVFFLLLCGVFFIWKLKKKKNNAGGKRQFVRDTLELAKSQFEFFNIKLPSEGNARAGYTASLEAIDADGLHMDVNSFMPEECKDKPVEVYFRARLSDGPVFYAFSSVVRNIQPDYENSSLVLEMPDHLRVEKKRHFNRVKPDKKDIRVIGVWPIKPGKRLPKTTSEMGPAATHYKPGMSSEPVQVEDISGAGLALRFRKQENEAGPDFQKGSQWLCLVVYVLDENEPPVAFWCTGEVMNVRETAGPSPESIVGLEFTNWAILEQASSEIHWAHSSPTRGARPMLRWVDKIEKNNARKNS